MQKSKKSRKQTKTYKNYFLENIPQVWRYRVYSQELWNIVFFLFFCFLFFLFAFLMSKTSGILFFFKFCLAVFFWFSRVFWIFACLTSKSSGILDICAFFRSSLVFACFLPWNVFQDFWNVLFWSFLKSLYVSWCFVDGFNSHSYEICHKHVFSLCFWWQSLCKYWNEMYIWGRSSVFTVKTYVW